MNEIRIAEYIKGLQDAVAKAINAADNEFHRVLIEEGEELVKQLANELYAKEGINYPTSNECLATARTMLWTAWTSWMWTAKSERDQSGEPEDINAKRVKPIFEILMKQAKEVGNKIGAKGRIPEKFIEESQKP